MTTHRHVKDGYEFVSDDDGFKVRRIEPDGAQPFPFRTRPSGELHTSGTFKVYDDAPALVHEVFPHFTEHFPNATALDLFGASVVFDPKAKTMTLRCGGQEKVLPIDE